MSRFLRSLTRWVDRGLIGPKPNTPRLPFRPLWDERRLDHLHVIDEEPISLNVLDRASPERNPE